MSNGERDRLLASVDAMLWSRAWHSWHRLPVDAKKWVDVEDLYQEAAIAVWKAAALWDRERHVKFSTFAFTVASNRLANFAQELLRRKRTAPGGFLASLDVWDAPQVRAPEVRPEPAPEQPDAVLAVFFADALERADA